MAPRIKFSDDLGQHMTPRQIAELLCQELPEGIGAAVDMAVGHGDLLLPLQKRWPKIRLHGIDCDPARLAQAALTLGASRTTLGDGLAAKLPEQLDVGRGRFAAVSNPPFLAMVGTAHTNSLIARAFPGVDSRHGLRRMEMAFFARALLEAKKRDGWVAIIMPSAFASGLQYAPYRKSLMETYRVAKAIEIRDGRFRDTEAATVLLIIDTSSRPTGDILIGEFNQTEGKLHPVHCGSVSSSKRLDATYWKAAHLHLSSAPTLRQVGADIARGTRSRAEAARKHQRLIHTTDLSRLTCQRVVLSRIRCGSSDVLAKPGDILLPRTGTRVRWEPVEVARGTAPISDHVLRIRAPRKFRQAVWQSFCHPDFPIWLRSVSKGVCATVLTKHELLDMPLFALGDR